MSDACCGDDRDRTLNAAPEAERLHQVPALRVAAVSGLVLTAGLVAGTGDWPGAGSVALAAALVLGGSTFVPATLRAARRRQLNVGTLMTLAAAGAVALGELGEAAMLAFLFSISEGLEGYALARTRRGLRSLLDLVPLSARVVRDGVEVELDPSELVVGDVLVVRPGERLATDGVVRRGNSAVDVSAVTEESIPVEVAPDSQVFAATINGSGVLEVQVSAGVAESSLARVIHIVEEAQERKAASQRIAERVARPLVPGVREECRSRMNRPYAPMAGSGLGLSGRWGRDGFSSRAPRPMTPRRCPRLAGVELSTVRSERRARRQPAFVI